MQELRDACAEVASRALYVSVNTAAIVAYAASLPLPLAPRASDDPLEPAQAGRSAPAPEDDDAREHAAARWLTLDAINFGSGWFPTLRKRPGLSGYNTIATELAEHFERDGPWSAEHLSRLDAATVAAVLGQDPGHELMALYAMWLRDLGGRIAREHRGRFTAPIDDAQRSAVAFARVLGEWDCFADRSHYGELVLPFLKRAQIAATDLVRAGVARFGDLDRLTMFADNLVPHVLRLDGVLSFDAELVARIEREELIEHGSREEVEIRACALHAVELIVAARPQTRAVDVDEVLWHRGQESRYKASPRHRSRCTAY